MPIEVTRRLAEFAVSTQYNDIPPEARENAKLAIADQKSLATGEIVERPELAVSCEKLNDVLGFKQFEALEQRFLTKEQLQAKYG